MKRNRLNFTHRDRKASGQNSIKGHNMELNSSEEGSGSGQVASVEYEITDGNRISPPGNPMKGNDLEEDLRNVGDEYSK